MTLHSTPRLEAVRRPAALRARCILAFLFPCAVVLAGCAYGREANPCFEGDGGANVGLCAESATYVWGITDEAPAPPHRVLIWDQGDWE